MLWEELLVVGRLGWKKNTLSDLPPTPVLLARAEVLATEVIRHLHLVPKDHAWHLSSPTHAHSLSSSSPTSRTRHAHRLETWRASTCWLLETLWEESQTALSACKQKIRLLSSGQQLVLGAGPGCVERHGQVLSAERWGGTRRVGRGEGLEE